MVLSAQGACRPYELRKGGSAIAIECSFSAEILIDVISSAIRIYESQNLYQASSSIGKPRKGGLAASY
jgi:hypothetical protein